MKKVSFFFTNLQNVITLCLFAFASCAPAMLLAQDVVFVYQEANFGGNNRGFKPGNFRQADLPGLANDAASSIKVTAGYEVIIFENDNYGGQSLVIDGDVKNLSDFDFNDKISSLKVQRKTQPTIAKLFRNAHHTGLYTSVKESIAIDQIELSKGVGNDAMSSVWLDPAYEVVLFKDKDFSGANLRLDHTDLSFGSAWDNQVSSVIIRPKVSGTPPNPLNFNYNQKFAIYMRGHGYLRYQVRDKGINLAWSDGPVYEWEVRDYAGASGKVKTGQKFSLYNHVEKDFLVYAERDNGINLRWKKDSNKNDAFDWTFESENLPGNISVFLKNRTLESLNKDAYVRYGPRSEGVNLVWDKKTSFAPFIIRPQ